MMDVTPYLELAVYAATEAGKICLNLQSHLGQVKYKSPKDVVTKADLESENFIVSCIQKKFPSHSIRTEEKGILDGSDNRFKWIIDPVDGTVNYSRGIPLWGISIALHFEGKPLVAVINLPKLKELYTATLNGGAFINGIPILVSRETNPNHCIVSNGDFNVGNVQVINTLNLKNFTKEAEIFERVKCLGSAVVESCFVASGRIDGFVMTTSYPWDIAAGALMVTEAKGRATHIDGSPLLFKDGEPVIFSNGHIHDILVKLAS